MRRAHSFAGWVLVLGALDFGLEQFIVIPVVPAAQQEHHASVAGATWLLTGFLLAAVAAAPTLSRLGDMYGKRRLLIVAIAAFSLGSLVCALADSLGVLIAGRVLQGVGAALGPLAVGLARDTAPRERAPAWIGILIAAAGAGAALGLLLGGLLVEYVSVAAVFWFMFALATALLPAVYLLVHEAPRTDSARPDWSGGLLLTAGLVAIVLAISHANAWGWASARVGTLLVAAGVALVAFVVVERSVDAPLVDVRMLKQRTIWSADALAFAMGFALFIAGVVVPQIAALPAPSGVGLGLSFAQTGLVLMPGALAIVVGGWVGGMLVARIGARAVVACGALAASAAYGAFAIEHGSVVAVTAANVPLGLGIGLAFAALINLAVRLLDPTRSSVGAATIAISRLIGAALGAQVAAAIVTAAASSPGHGFTAAFLLGLGATLVALLTTLALPRAGDDPLREWPHAGPGSAAAPVVAPEQ